MLAPHLGHSPLPDQVALILPRPRGGIAPSRREVALADYLEKQRENRRANPCNLRKPRLAVGLSIMIRRAYLAATQMLAHSKQEAPWKGQDQRATVNQAKSAVGRTSAISPCSAQR